MKRKINLAPCIGSDTLLQNRFSDKQFYLKANNSYGLHCCKIAEQIWQSTANKLVIPYGLVCDIEFHCYDSDAVETITGIPTEALTQLDDEQNNRWFRGSVLSIKIVGLADGWEY